MRAGVAVALGLALVGTAGCGGSSKPDYCSKRDALDSAVKGLPGAVKTGGTGGLQAQLKTVESDANAMISAAKSDFPTETQTLETNVSQLKSAVASLGSNPSATEIAPVVVDAAAVVNAVKSLTSATKSACQ